MKFFIYIVVLIIFGVPTLIAFPELIEPGIALAGLAGKFVLWPRKKPEPEKPQPTCRVVCVERVRIIR